jgi:hypothetical protein
VDRDDAPAASSLCPCVSRALLQRTWYSCSPCFCACRLTTHTLLVGHQLVASIAQRLLSPKARECLTQILQPSSLDLAAIAPWADRVKHTRAYFWTASLHYINPIQDFPPGTCAPDFSDVRTPDRTLLTAIKNYTERLGDESLHRWGREEALRFLVHFIGDSEQPLHRNLDIRHLVFLIVHSNWPGAWGKRHPLTI